MELLLQLIHFGLSLLELLIKVLKGSLLFFQRSGFSVDISYSLLELLSLLFKLSSLFFYLLHNLTGISSTSLWCP